MAGGEIPRHGFRLRITDRNGRHCSRCHFLDCCIGCTVPDDDRSLVVADGETISADYHITTMHEHFDRSQITKVTMHPSLEENEKASNKPVSLDECAANFAKDEDIDEAYCSKCKGHHKSVKRMKIWRLPPIMMVHLKRFKVTERGALHKLRNFVSFKTRNQDFSSIVAENMSNGKWRRGERGKEDGSVMIYITFSPSYFNATGRIGDQRYA